MPLLSRLRLFKASLRYLSCTVGSFVISNVFLSVIVVAEGGNHKVSSTSLDEQWSILSFWWQRSGRSQSVEFPCELGSEELLGKDPRIIRGQHKYR
jgi:hypothetical protein